MRHSLCSATIGLLTALCGATPALADAIDGNWCAADGRRVQIDGPAIVTPGGRHLQGSYDRHHFSYVVPTPEAGAGKTVAMALMGETAVRIQFGDGEPEVWSRCAPRLSLQRQQDQEKRTGNG